ncbi:hypothetical protein F5144DRAFT_495954 [Chaetomium tenue]|uniref:Uncharacterized protein n=1 Tax=Chaetomium tenue TaxID=1854479 RepID=A0ACB7NYF4_9PEZI|nr:hypothetical protein F5144DRAFT_495954 [Chaetomium globosum]
MSLYDLPSELVIQILASAASLSDLRALASTSRTVYRTFEREKAALIYQVLANELGPVIDDAAELSHLQRFDPRAPDYFSDDYRNSITRYGEYLSGHGHTPPRQVSLDYVLRLVRTYRTMATLSNIYITCTFNLIECEALPVCHTSNTPDLLAAPSRSEWLRVLRAHYRLEMVLSSYLAGQLRRAREVRSSKAALFGLWSPWEIQQTFCVGGFYKKLEYQITRLADGEMHRKADLGTGFVPLFDWAEYIKEFRAMDEAWWQKVLGETSRFPCKQGATPANDQGSSGIWLASYQEVSDLAWHRQGWGEWSARHGLAQRHKFPAPLRFDGDFVAAVPFAWVDAFAGYYGYHYWGMPGGTHPRLALKGLWSFFGLVLWDRPRVQALKTCPSSTKSLWATGWLSASSA